MFSTKYKATNLLFLVWEYIFVGKFFKTPYKLELQKNVDQKVILSLRKRREAAFEFWIIQDLETWKISKK